jgi:hypothetical protein
MSGAVPVALVAGSSRCAGTRPAGPPAEPIATLRSRLSRYAGAEQRLCPKAPQAYAQIVILAAQNGANQHKPVRTNGEAL